MKHIIVIAVAISTSLVLGGCFHRFKGNIVRTELGASSEVDVAVKFYTPDDRHDDGERLLLTITNRTKKSIYFLRWFFLILSEHHKRISIT